MQKHFFQLFTQLGKFFLLGYDIRRVIPFGLFITEDLFFPVFIILAGFPIRSHCLFILALRILVIRHRALIPGPQSRIFFRYLFLVE